MRVFLDAQSAARRGADDAPESAGADHRLSQDDRNRPIDGAETASRLVSRGGRCVPVSHHGLGGVDRPAWNRPFEAGAAGHPQPSGPQKNVV
mgnify:CR=1 FL=1